MTKPLKETLSFGLKFQLFILTLACCAVVFLLLGPWPAIKASPLYFVFLGIAELFHWSQMRQNVRCDVCDFDPILYKEDWRKARALVEAKMQGAFTKATAQMKDAMDFAASPIVLGGDKKIAAPAVAAKIEGPAKQENFKIIPTKSLGKNPEAKL